MELKYINTEDFARIDRESINKKKVPASILMENAGNGMGQIIVDTISEGGEHVLVLCGQGNNGGDGLVTARFLAKAGFSVEVVIMGSRKKGTSLWQEKLSLLGHFCPVTYAAGLTPALKKAVKKADLVIDALFGTGLSRPMGGYYASLALLINGCRGRIISLDIPSGLQHVLSGGSAVRADHTLTVQYHKSHFLFPWYAAYTGQVHTVTIDFPPQVVEPYLRSIEIPDRKAASDRGRMENKLSRGRSLILAGSRKYKGAVMMSAAAAVYAGAPYLMVASPVCLDLKNMPQLISAQTGGSVLAAEDLGLLKKNIRESRHLLFGPGVDRQETTTEFLAGLLKADISTIIIDADGIWHLGRLLKTGLKLKKNTRLIITPHLGEFSALTGQDSDVLRQDLFRCISDFSGSHRIDVLLKDAYMYYYCREGLQYFPWPNPMLAKAGSGDILAGWLLAYLSYYRDVRTAVGQAILSFTRRAELIRDRFGIRTPVTGIYDKRI